MWSPDWIAQAQGPQSGQAQAVALDGKTLRGSQGHQLPGVHLLAAFRTHLGVATAQEPAGQGPGGELAAAAQLPARLDLAGVVITG